MSTPFQNRLVGTIIVAAVAIIVLPDLLDGNKKTFQDEFEQIPPPPQVEFVKAPRDSAVFFLKTNSHSDSKQLAC